MRKWRKQSETQERNEQASGKRISFKASINFSIHSQNIHSKSGNQYKPLNAAQIE
jgi:hypothetical protein